MTEIILDDLFLQNTQKYSYVCLRVERNLSEYSSIKIYKCKSISSHTLSSDSMYFVYFKNYSGLVSVKRKKSYCKACVLLLLRLLVKQGQ